MTPSPCPDKHTYLPQSARDIPQINTAQDGFCQVREDNLHCSCWWNEGKPSDKPCCACGYEDTEVGLNE